MTARRLLAALLLALLGGAAGACSMGAKSQGDNRDGGGGAPNGDSGGGGAGGAGGSPECSVSFKLWIPDDFAKVMPGPGAKVRLEGMVHDFGGARAPLWRWTTLFADGAAVPTTAVAGNPALVEIPVERPGTYDVQAVVSTDPPCAGEQPFRASPPGARVESFRLRLTPPPDRGPVQELSRDVWGRTPSGGNVLAIDPGSRISIDPRRGAARLPSFIRLTTATGIELAGRSGAGPFDALLGDDAYAALLVPDGPTAPLLLAAKTHADFSAADFDLVTDGTLVAGTVTDGDGPVAGAKIVLRAGPLPSTVGSTDAAGAFSLRARPGTFSAVIAPPPGRSLAHAVVDPSSAGSGVVIGPGSSPVAIDFAWAKVDLASLSFHVAGGGLARVHVESPGTARAGTLTVKGGAPAVLAARGAVRLDTAADPNGDVTIPDLPRGSIQVTIVPPAGGDPAAAVTTLTFDLGGGSVNAGTVSLASRVDLRGSLGEGLGDPAAGVPIFAVDTGGDVPPIAYSTRTDSAGGYAISVDPNRTYALFARPEPGQPLARTDLGSVASGAGNDVGLKIMMPGLLFAGKVVAGQQPAAGTLVQAYCPKTAATCDPATPVAEAIARADGFFALTLPDPGVAP